jgi:hypothetical protein
MLTLALRTIQAVLLLSIGGVVHAQPTPVPSIAEDLEVSATARDYSLGRLLLA